MIKTKRTISVISLALIFAMVLSMLGGALAVTQAEIDDLKKQQQDINNQKKALQGTIGDLQGKMEETMNLKATLDEQNELTRQEIELINEQIDLYEGLVEQKGIELEEAIADETRQKEELRVRMRKMEESGNVSYISILFNATSFMDLLSRLDSIDMILKRDKDVEEAYIAAREHVEQVKAEYEATLADCEATKVELDNKKAQLEQEIAIMRMVGATNSFIRTPFVIEGLVLGLIGSALAFFALWGLYELVCDKVMAGIAGSLINVVPFQQLMFPVGACFLGMGVFVGLFGGSIAIRNYLKV